MSSAPKRQVRFQRANFLVSNFDRALILYRDILGLEEAFIKDSEEDSYSYEVFEINRDSSMRMAVLSSETQPRGMALTEVANPGLDTQSLPRRAAIVLQVEDVDGIVADCKQHGFDIYREERLETHDGRVGREIGIVDDDGNLVVIYYIAAAT